MINPSGKYRNNPDSSLYEIEQWMKNLSDNGAIMLGSGLAIILGY